MKYLLFLLCFLGTLHAHSQDSETADLENQWYTLKKLLDYYCESPLKANENPGDSLATFKSIYPKSHLTNEKKENGKIIYVNLVVPERNASVVYVRGKTRCESISNKLNSNIKKESKDLSERYK